MQQWLQAIEYSGRLVAGEGAKLKDFSLRGREAGDGGRQRGDRGEMCDRLTLTFCTILKNRQDACEAKSRCSCGVGILPARERLINNDARYQNHRKW
ncbi:hypothetical protein QUA56_13850 [Microcoleus sp. N3A4]|uniref:hypothetical protein n=1 Tax=Microcoleus sp. N3A4 TaxID=3055379 RepID=UPI002FD08ADB